MKEKIIAFVKRNSAGRCSHFSCNIRFFVHPDQAYIDYIDFRVLGILLSLMIIMAGVQNNGIFDGIGRRLLCAYEKYGAAGICSCFSVFLFKHGHYQ